jgi:hypothetical protein
MEIHAYYSTHHETASRIKGIKQGILVEVPVLLLPAPEPQIIGLRSVF